MGVLRVEVLGAVGLWWVVERVRVSWIVQRKGRVNHCMCWTHSLSYSYILLFFQLRSVYAYCMHLPVKVMGCYTKFPTRLHSPLSVSDDSKPWADPMTPCKAFSNKATPSVELCYTVVAASVVFFILFFLFILYLTRLVSLRLKSLLQERPGQDGQ